MKLSKANKATADQFQESIEYTSMLKARVLAECPNLPEWFDRSAEYYAGMTAAYEGALSTLLMNNKAYKGYQESHGTKCNVTYTFNRYL